jgi:hypothetical protein
MYTYTHTHKYTKYTLLFICTDNYYIYYQDEPCITFVSHTVIYIYVCVYMGVFKFIQDPDPE